MCVEVRFTWTFLQKQEATGTEEEKSEFVFLIFFVCFEESKFLSTQITKTEVNLRSTHIGIFKLFSGIPLIWSCLGFVKNIKIVMVSNFAYVVPI